MGWLHEYGRVAGGPGLALAIPGQADRRDPARGQLLEIGILRYTKHVDYGYTVLLPRERKGWRVVKVELIAIS